MTSTWRRMLALLRGEREPDTEFRATLRRAHARGAYMITWDAPRTKGDPWTCSALRGHGPNAEKFWGWGVTGLEALADLVAAMT